MKIAAMFDFTHDATAREQIAAWMERYGKDGKVIAKQIRTNDQYWKMTKQQIEHLAKNHGIKVQSGRA